MQRFLKLTGLLLTAALLAGCMGSESEVSQSAPTGVFGTSSLKSFSVSLAKDVKVNKMLRLDNADTAKTAQQVLAHMNHVLKTEFGQNFKGETPVIVTVSISSIDISSGAGRTMGSASYMNAHVTVVEARSGKTLKTGVIRTEQKPFRASGNIGFIIMLAANSDTTEEKRYAEMAQAFQRDLIRWIRR